MDEVKRLSKAKHEERTHINVELDEFCIKYQHQFNRCLAIGLTGGLRINQCIDIDALESAYEGQLKKIMKHRLN